MLTYARPLDNNRVVEGFLKYALELDYGNDANLINIVSRIVDGELGVSKFNVEEQTWSQRDMRHENYRSDEKRWELRKNIVEELWQMERLEDDEEITLGNGGALPIGGNVKYDKQAFLLIGLPASGKSGIASEISKDLGALIVDSDYAKRKLPEYSNHYYGASIVHEESSKITTNFGDNNPHNIRALYQLCIDNGANIIIPKIGNNPQGIINLTKALVSENGYDVHLILVSTSKKTATTRAVYRYAATKRYVPLGLIFDEYGNDPSHCYYYLKSKFSDLFKGMGVVSTESRPAVCTDKNGHFPILPFNFKDIILRLP